MLFILCTHSKALPTLLFCDHLADIDTQAQERMERLTEQMKLSQGITEQLKSESARMGAGAEWHTERGRNVERKLSLIKYRKAAEISPCRLSALLQN